MLKWIFLGAVAAFLPISLGSQSATDPATAGQPAPLKDGRVMFSKLCVSCHGEDARGLGPVVVEHKVPPVNLTQLSRRHGGVFPAPYVRDVLEHGVKVPSHTSVVMPVWGPKLGKMNESNPREREERVSALVAFLETIQER